MKRSQINNVMRETLDFLVEHRFPLPPFAYWTPERWKRCGTECSDIVDQQLGWDITDFGNGDYLRCGLFLFTIRNETLADLERPDGKVYAEKILVVGEDQVTPTHYHFQKKEDIINRGGGELVLRLWNCTEDGHGLADTPVVVAKDGVRTEIAPGADLVLTVGESVCLPQKLWHTFWAKTGYGTVLVGEVSRVNDDHTDNLFLNPVGRFPEIEEDELPMHLLYNDYPRYYRFVASEIRCYDEKA